MLIAWNDQKMIVSAYDELALGYRRVRTDAAGAEVWRELPGSSFAFALYGPGVGARLNPTADDQVAEALGLIGDEVTASSTRRVYRGGTTFEMRHDPRVGPALAGMHGLQWSLVRLRKTGNQTLADGQLTITRAASAATAPRPSSGGGGMYIFIDRRP